MLKNEVYNLLAQLNEEHKSLWRIKKHYLEDVEDCKECKEFWERMVVDKEEHIEELKELVKKHI